jgi:hypothetical protein
VTNLQLSKFRNNPNLSALTLAFLLSLFLAPVAARAQQYYAGPEFPAGTENTSILVYGAPGLAPFGSSTYPSALFMAYPNSSGYVGTAFSTDGRNYTDQGEAISSSGQSYHVACSGSGILQPTCGVGVAVFKGTLYFAYANSGNNGLAVVAVTPKAGESTYNFSLVEYITSVVLTSAPAVTVSPDGTQLLIRYGTSASNTTYTTRYNGSAWTTVASGSNAPTQSALVVFNGTLYAIDKQNNSNNGVWVSKLDNNGVYISGTGFQVANWYSSTGFSGIVYHNTNTGVSNIVVTYGANTGSHTLQLESSPDGVNWYAFDQGGSIGGVAAITNWDNQVPLAFRCVCSQGYLYSDIAPDNGQQ